MINIKSLEHYGLQIAMYGMRLPLLSHRDMDTISNDVIGEKDLILCRKLINAGPDHRKFLRQIHITINLVAPQYFFREFDTYKVSTTSNSTSQMHKIMSRHLTQEDFSFEDCDSETDKYMINQNLNYCNMLIDTWKVTKEEKVFRKLQQQLSQSYNYERTFTCSMETLYNMYKSRKKHKLKEWREFCIMLESNNIFRQLFL